MSADSQYEHEFLPPHNGWQHRGNGGVYAPIDASTNKALPWIAWSWFLSGGAILGIIILCLLGPGLIDSRVEARVARAEALAELARKEASIAKDMMDVERAKRMAREEIKK